MFLACHAVLKTAFVTLCITLIWRKGVFWLLHTMLDEDFEWLGKECSNCLYANWGSRTLRASELGPL